MRSNGITAPNPNPRIDFGAGVYFRNVVAEYYERVTQGGTVLYVVQAENVEYAPTLEGQRFLSRELSTT